MTRRALLHGPLAGDPDARVAALPVLLRQLLSLQDAGIDTVDLADLPADRWPRDSRLTLALRPAGSGGPGEPEPVLTARIGLVWHRMLPRRLVLAGYRGDIERAPLTADEFVVPVGGETERRRAEDLLFQSLLKATDGLISRSINRRISLRVTRALLDTSLTPNQMTLIAALFGFAAIAVVLAGGVTWLVPGAVLLQAQSILDGCDGEISRLKYIRSRLGEWLDQVLDDMVNLGFFAATGWTLYQAGSAIALPLTIGGTLLHIIYQVALYTALVTRGGGSGSVSSIRWRGLADHGKPRPVATRPPGLLQKVKEVAEMAARRDFFTFLYLPAALVGEIEIALAWCAMIFALSGIGVGLHWLIWGPPLPAGSAAGTSSAR